MIPVLASLKTFNKMWVTRKESNDILDNTKASHNAWAYRFIQKGQIYARAHDNVEVSRTVSDMILRIMERKEIVDAIVFVTWYKVV